MRQLTFDFSPDIAWYSDPIYVTPLQREAVEKGFEYLNHSKHSLERSIALNAVAALIWNNHGWRPAPDYTLLYFQLLLGILGRNGYLE